MMVILKVKYVQKGAHVHCRVFSRQGVSITWQKCGDLVFGVEEWNEVLVSFECGGFEVEPEVER